MPAISTAIPLSQTGRWLAFIVMLTGGLLPSVDFFIINVSLPSIHTSIGANPAELQLVVSGYAATYAVFLITGGRLGDLYGRRRMFLIGMAGFVATNTLCGLADTPMQLVIGRVLQGVSAAMLVPQVLRSIRALFPSEAELASALSFYGVMMGLAASIGQFAGGALVEWSPFDWGWRRRCCMEAVKAARISTKPMNYVTRTESGFATRIMRFSARTAIATSPC